MSDLLLPYSRIPIVLAFEQLHHDLQLINLSINQQQHQAQLQDIPK